MQDVGGKWVQVRSLCERRHLLFRYNPDHDLIEVMVRGQLEVVCLNDYRLPERPRVGLDFQRIDDGDTP